MTKKAKNLIAFIIIAGGIILMCYPSFAGFVNQMFANREIADYSSKIDSTDEEELTETIQKAYRYNSSLPGGYPADPFTGSNIADLKGTAFEDFWMVQEGAMIGYVEVPSIDVYLPIYYGTSAEVLSEGAGLVENTSLPVGGRSSHAVISAHTGLASKRLFTDLDLMKKGDLFFVHVLNQDFAYKVDQIKVVLPSEVEDLYIEEGRDCVTLLTCTPFGVNDHRLLVRGERIDYDFSRDSDVKVTSRVILSEYLWLFVSGAALAVLLCTGIVKRRKNKTRESGQQSAE